MPNITLPDGKQLSFSESVTGFQLAEKISKSLSKQALIISVDGQLKDLDFKIEKDSKVKIFTSKDKEGLETIRHDTAHILAMAVQELFPGTQVTIILMLQQLLLKTKINCLNLGTLRLKKKQYYYLEELLSGKVTKCLLKP